MSPAINAGEPAVGELAEQAAQAIRTVNHLTRPAIGMLDGPAEAAELVAALAQLTGGVPQLLGQLSGWLVGQHRAGRLRIDGLSPDPDPAAATDAATGQLALAAQCTHAAARALDAAHQHLAHLAGTADAEPEDQR